MAKNYDDYGYEDDERSNRKRTTRKLLIIVLIVIAIFLILYLVKGCSANKPSGNKVKPDENLPTPVDTFNYESALIESGKNYFITNSSEDAKSIGECSIVDLQTLINNRLIDADKFNNCNVNTTFLRVCVLENGVKQYTPWFNCLNKVSDNDYSMIAEGNLQSVVKDSTYTEFKFLPQYLKKGGENLGPVEEIWKDDIKYNQYKTLSTTTYYRYKEKSYIWSLTKNYYYTSSGDKTNEADVIEYYPSSPRSGYNYTTGKSDVYKWYESTSSKEYYTVNGEKALSQTAVGQYTNRDPVGVDITRYRTRTVTSSYSPYLYNICSTNATNTRVVYQYDPCGKGSNPSYNYNRGTVYSCASPTAVDESIIGNIVPYGTTCKKYSAWSSPTTTRCDTTKTDICQAATVSFYYWYKTTGEVRTYYPSGSKVASGEKIYYKTAPIKNAIKDESTRVTGYKWFKQSTSTSGYSATAPSGYSNATKTSQSRWSDWSNWSTTNPSKSGVDRQIETKIKIKLQEIKPSTSDAWVNLNENYLSEEELIKLFNDKGYKVNSLEDITNNGEIKYQVKMYVRNKKERN